MRRRSRVAGFLERGLLIFVVKADFIMNPVLTDGRASEGEKAFIDSLQAALHVDEPSR